MKRKSWQRHGEDISCLKTNAMSLCADLWTEIRENHSLREKVESALGLANQKLAAVRCVVSDEVLHTVSYDAETGTFA